MTGTTYKINVFRGIWNLLLGLAVTLRHLFSHAVTLQYPSERWTMPERSRGVVVLLSDKETGELNCTACLLCAKACPTAAIMIERHRGEDKKWRLDRFDIDNSICCYCGLCEEACNFTAIKLTPKYEFSSYDKPSLVYNMQKLQELGCDVDFVVKPKKSEVKPTASPAPAQGTATMGQQTTADAGAAGNPQSPETTSEEKGEGI